MEDVAAAMDAVSPGAPRWFQLYWSVDEQLVDSFLNRAEAMGAAAIAVTLDTTMLGWRPQDLNPGRCPSPAVRASRSTRATRGSGRSSMSVWQTPTPTRRRRSRRSGDKDAGVHRAQRAGQLVAQPRRQASARGGRDVPGDLFAAQPRGPTSRTCARTPLPIVLKGVLHPTTRGTRSTSASTGSSCPTTADGRSTALSVRSTPSSTWSMRLAGAPRSSSTRASTPGPTCSRRWRWGLTRRASAGRTCTGWPSRGNGGARGAHQHRRRARPHAGAVGAHRCRGPGPWRAEGDWLGRPVSPRSGSAGAVAPPDVGDQEF